MLLQSVFIGKAREIYSSLSIEQCHDYEVVKKAVLKAYELVPEVYRQRFRSAKKETNQTHVEFAREQEQMLDRWLSSKNVNIEFKQLRQLVLIEQFKDCIHADIKTVALPALSVRRGKVKEPSRFLPFLPDFSSFSPIFPDFFPLFPGFWQIFRCQGWHSAPLATPVATPLHQNSLTRYKQFRSCINNGG